MDFVLGSRLREPISSNRETRMTFKTILAALALTLTPGLAMAMCSDRHINTTAMSCADGMVWDSESRTCTAPVTG
jgi:hypothetical protein